MQPHEQRVVDEATALKDSVDKLDTFIKGGIFKTLHDVDRALLTTQLSLMKNYHDVLAKRISRFQ